MSKLRITVRGNLGQLSAESFAEVLTRALKVLRDIDLRLSNGRQKSVRWVVSGLFESSAGIVLESRPVRGPDRSREIRDAFTGGIAKLEQGTTPPYFSTNDVASVQKMVQRIGVEGVTGIGFQPEDVAEDQPRATVELTRTADLALAKLTGIAYRAIGSIEGRVELVSVKRAARRFNVTENRTLRSVRCTFPDDVEDAVFAAIQGRRRVIITGKIAYNGANEPVSIFVTRPIRFLKEDRDLPSASDLAGADLDLSGPLSTEDFLRTVRDA